MKDELVLIKSNIVIILSDVHFVGTMGVNEICSCIHGLMSGLDRFTFLLFNLSKIFLLFA